MRSILILIILLSLYSCNKKESVWNDLTPDEQRYLAEREEAKCLAKVKSFFDKFKTNSNENFYGSKAYDRGITWTYTYKKSSASDNLDTSKFTIWKVTNTDVYLLNVINDEESFQFIKIPMTTNETMIDNLKTALCTKSDILTVTSGSNTGTIVYKRKTNGTIPKEYTHTFTYTQNLLAFFANLKEARTEQPLDNDGKPNGTAVKYTGALTGSSKPSNTPQYNTYQDYVDTNIKIELCVLSAATVSTSGTSPFPLSCLPTAFDTNEL